MLAFDWKGLAAPLLSQALWLAAVGWLIQSFISHRQSRDIEKFKSDLQAEANEKMEGLKSALQMQALEHQVRFSRLHEKRADIIAELFQLIVDLERSSRIYVFGGGASKDEQQEREVDFSIVRQPIDRCYRFVEQNEIYLPARVLEALGKFMGVIRTHVGKLYTFGNVDPSQSEIDREVRKRVYSEAFNALEVEIPTLKKALVDEIRKLLGEEEATPT